MFNRTANPEQDQAMPRQAELNKALEEIGDPPDDASANALAAYAAIQAQEARKAAVRTRLEVRWTVEDIRHMFDLRLASIESALKLESAKRAEADHYNATATQGAARKAGAALALVGRHGIAGAAFAIVMAVIRFFFGF